MAAIFIRHSEQLPFADLPFSNISLFHLYDFWWDKLRPGCFSLSNREKKCLWCLLCRESWFMCKLSVGLYLLSLWRVHMQIKGSVGQGWVRVGFSSGHNDGVRIVVKDYQTDCDVLSLFTYSLECKINFNKQWAFITLNKVYIIAVYYY